MTQELARIKEAGFGNRDVGEPVLFFTTELESGACALQVLHGERALGVIQKSGVWNVSDLNGQFCWVDKRVDSCSFDRLWGEEAS